MNEMMTESEKEFFKTSHEEFKEALEKYMSKKELSPEEAQQMALDLQVVSQKFLNKDISNEN